MVGPRLMRLIYSNFEKRPVPTLMITNGALNSLGDLVVSKYLDLSLER